jgi:hypothetical protein
MDSDGLIAIGNLMGWSRDWDLNNLALYIVISSPAEKKSVNIFFGNGIIKRWEYSDEKVVKDHTLWMTV